jgi:hypothetical protein
MKRTFAALLLIYCAIGVGACATTQSGQQLHIGMTADQAIAALGQPDLKDTVTNPNQPGVSELRYVWLEPHKVAVFGADNRAVSIADVQTAAPAGEQAQQQPAAPPAEFDPIATPLDYAFFPFKAAITYLAAGINCLGGGGCHMPRIQPPSQG